MAIVASSVIARSTSVAVVCPCPRAASPSRRPRPTARRRASSGGGAGRFRNTCPRSTPTSPAAPALPSIRSVRRGSRTSGEAAPRNVVTAATTTPPPASSGASGSIRSRTTSPAPSGISIAWSHSAMSPVGLGTESATPVWAGPQATRQDPEQAGVPRLGVATRRHRRIRPAPVERRVDRVRDGGEGALAPADDALVHLEPPAHDPADRPPRRQLHGVSGQRLADRRDPADRQVGRTTRDRVPPGVAEMGDHDVTDRAARAQVDDHLAVEQEPAALGRRAGELERQASEDLATGRQPSDRVAIARVEPRAQLAVARIALSPQVDRGREGRRSRRRHRRGPAVVFVRRGTRDHPPRQPALTLSRRYASVRATDCTSHRMHAKAEGHRSVGACATPSGQQPRTDVIMVAPPPWAA